VIPLWGWALIIMGIKVAIALTFVSLSKKNSDAP
jgi:hypothetical protein